MVLWILNGMIAFSLIVAVFILGLRKKRTFNTMLQQPLRIGGSVEMSSS